MYESVKFYSVSISLGPMLYKLTNVICYYSPHPSLTPQWPDSVLVYMCVVRVGYGYGRNPYLFRTD